MGLISGLMKGAGDVSFDASPAIFEATKITGGARIGRAALFFAVWSGYPRPSPQRWSEIMRTRLYGLAAALGIATAVAAGPAAAQTAERTPAAAVAAVQTAVSRFEYVCLSTLPRFKGAAWRLRRLHDRVAPGLGIGGAELFETRLAVATVDYRAGITVTAYNRPDRSGQSFCGVTVADLDPDALSPAFLRAVGSAFEDALTGPRIRSGGREGEVWMRTDRRRRHLIVIAPDRDGTGVSAGITMQPRGGALRQP